MNNTNDTMRNTLLRLLLPLIRKNGFVVVRAVRVFVVVIIVIMYNIYVYDVMRNVCPQIEERMKCAMLRLGGCICITFDTCASRVFFLICKSDI